MYSYKAFLYVSMFIVAAAATSPYVTTSHCEYNPASLKDEPHRGCASYLTQAQCESKAYCWWRDTTVQNALAEHTAAQTTGEVITAYLDDNVGVYVYSAKDVAQPIAIVTATKYFIIGCGGGNKPAAIAKAAFAATIPGFATKTLAGILMTHSHVDHIWGCPVWTNNTAAVRYAHSAWPTVVQTQQAVQTSLFKKVVLMFGQDLAWGADKFLGTGLSYQFTSKPLQLWQAPTSLVAATKNITIDGVVITLIPSLGETDDQVVAYLPVQRVLFPADNWYASVVNGYTIRGTVARPLTRWASSLDALRSITADVMVPEHMLPIYGADNIKALLVAQRDALTYIHDQTVAMINNGVHLDTIVSSVALTSDMNANPALQQFYGYVPFIIRSVYDYYMGWYNGDIASLETLSNTENAQRLVSIAGYSGTKKAAVKAITEHTRNGALWALKLANALRIMYPNDYDVAVIYLQALKMLGWTTINGPARNWYLTVAQTTEASMPTVEEDEEDDRKKRDADVEYDSRLEPMWVVMPHMGQFIHLDSTEYKSVKIVFTDYADFPAYATWHVTVRGPVAEVVAEEVVSTDYDVIVSCNSDDFRAAWLQTGVSEEAFTFGKGTYAQLAEFLALFY